MRNSDAGVRWDHKIRTGILVLGVIAIAAILAPTDTIELRGAILRGLIGSYASEGNFDLRVLWTKDSTVNPTVGVASTQGKVGGGTTVHLSLHLPANAMTATVTELRVHEVAGHTADLVQYNLPFNAQWDPRCDPDPSGQNPPHMAYCDWMWPSPAGHNGNHKITATISYTTWTGTTNGGIDIQTVISDPKSITVDVENLAITATAPENPEPITWTPASMSSVDLSVTIDAAYKANQTVRLRIYTSTQSLIRTIQQTVPVGDGPTDVSFTWNGTGDYTPPGGTSVYPKGIYLFRFDVYSIAMMPPDTDTDKSSLLSVTQTDYAIIASNGDNKTVRGKYLLTDQANPRKNGTVANVRSYDPDIAMVAGPTAGGVITNSSGDIPQVWNTVTYSMPAQKAGTYILLYSAKDDHANEDKAHRSRWALQRNQDPGLPQAMNYDFTYPANLPGPRTTTPYARYAATLQNGPLADNKTAYRAQWTTNSNGAGGLAMLKKSAIFSTFGHGGIAPAGNQQFFVTFWNGTAWSCFVETDFGRDKLELAYPNATIHCFADEPNDAFKSVLLAVFEGCKTATRKPGTSAWGSPTWGVVTKGAKSAVGFVPTIHSHGLRRDGSVNPNELGAEEWAEVFWHSLCVQGTTVKEAALAAGRPTFPKFGLRDSVVAGEQQLKITPARYGTPPVVNQ